MTDGCTSVKKKAVNLKMALIIRKSSVSKH